MNSDTYHSSRKNSNDYNQIMLTGGFGIGYVHWFEKFGIESNISYKKKGHNYMVYVEGRLYEKKINLDYINASLQIRKCITKDETKLSKSFLSGGVYYGRILHQDIVFNGLPYGNLTNYSKNNFGLSLSYEKVLVTKKKNISLGISVSQGLMNIYKGNSYIEFNKTYNATLSGSVKYLISFKK